MLVPSIGRQVSSGVKWQLSDFLIGGIILFSLGLLIAFVAQNIENQYVRLVVTSIIQLSFLVVWDELVYEFFSTLFARS